MVVSPPENATDAERPGIAEEELYRIIRLAVEDAILGVLGTLLLLGIATVIILVGVQMMAVGLSAAWVVVGALVTLFGLYVAAVTLGVIPSVREYLASR